ncbi:hypothetical protein Ntsu_80330 [Nocardia sp. IFM 10818]
MFGAIAENSAADQRRMLWDVSGIVTQWADPGPSGYAGDLDQMLMVRCPFVLGARAARTHFLACGVAAVTSREWLRCHERRASRAADRLGLRALPRAQMSGSCSC